VTAHAQLLTGNRLHLNHGPIDLIIGADGDAKDVQRAYRAACTVFPSILPALVAEQPFLRSPVGKTGQGPGRDNGHILEDVRSIPHRMYGAVWPFRDRFITPMAAVAGSVADHVLGVMLAAAPLRRAYVNNGGDIALHLAPGTTFTAGVVGDQAAPGIDAHVVINPSDGIGGIATSGWRGRSQSLGIADSVTVLAASAAEADAAATIIANAVNVDDPAVDRRPAHEVKDGSDLGSLLVTVAVGPLSVEARHAALASGVACAVESLKCSRIIASYIQLQGDARVVGAQSRALHVA
jgi:uncharacterized protein